MAKLLPNNNDTCPVCCCYYTVEVRQVMQSNWSGYNSENRPTTEFYKSCACQDTWVDNINKAWLKQKEQTVTKEFDTTGTKNTALQGIKQRVEELERALYNRTHAIAKVEAEHTKLIADANIALTNAVAQAYQMGIEEEDFENHLPDYQDDLTDRLNVVADSMSLANVLEGV